MKLEKYLDISGIERQQFAEMVGCTPQTISNFIHRKSLASLDLACKIEIVTKGKVTPQDLYQHWLERFEKSA